MEVLVITNKKIEKERAELIKKIYELGFEVGLKNHSEIGWVLREFNDLSENALSVGIKSPETYYHDGKLKGKKSKDKGSEEKPHEKSNDLKRKSLYSDLIIESNDLIDEFEVIKSQRRPELNDLPGLVKQARMIKKPRLLEGFKPLKLSRLNDKKN